MRLSLALGTLEKQKDENYPQQQSLEPVLHEVADNKNAKIEEFSRLFQRSPRRTSDSTIDWARELL